MLNMATSLVEIIHLAFRKRIYAMHLTLRMFSLNYCHIQHEIYCCSYCFSYIMTLRNRIDSYNDFDSKLRLNYVMN